MNISPSVITDPVLWNDWHVVARVHDLPLNQAKPARLLGVDLVIWRNETGFQVWQDLCIHRGAKLSLGRVEKGCLVCPYHGWAYDTSGTCVRIPAHPGQKPPSRARASVFHVRIQYDLVWVCLGDPDRDVPCFPEWEDPSYRKVQAGPYTFRALGTRIIENFLDVGHFSFVHEGFLGDPLQPEIMDYEVEISSEGLIARDIPIWQPNPDGTGESGLVHYTYQTLRPLTAWFTKKQGDLRFIMIDIVTPVDRNTSLAWGILILNYAMEAEEEAIRQYQDMISMQDIPIVESQRPELLPLDLQEELHLRSDRAAIAYRQWLKKLDLKYGTA